MSETLPTSRRCGLSGTALKRIACVTMLIDHIGASCIEAGVGTAANCPVGLLKMDQILRLIGRLAFPIFCFLLVEGFLHTHDVKQYLRRLLLFGAVSEIPFDMAFFRVPVYGGHQNVYWTLALGVIAMAAMQRSQDAAGRLTWQGGAAAVACALAAELAATDYGAIGVALIAALYLTRKSRTQQSILGAGMMLFELTAPLAFVLTWFYNGQRGRCPQWAKWAFYLFYPVHLVVLGVITNVLLR